MKKKNRLLILIFLVGTSLLLYPTIGSIINKYRQLKVINNYEETVSIIDNTENDKLYEAAVLYNEKVYDLQKKDSTYRLSEEYNQVLKVNSTNVLGYIEIPKVNIRLPIYHGVEDNSLAQGVGHVRETSLPIGTNNQNSMLMGHSGLPASKIFTNLEKLKKDDYIKITILNRVLYYKIYNIEIIEPEELINKIAIEDDRDLITLVTCTPYGVNSHRLVLTAERTEDIIEDENTTISSKNYLMRVILITLGILLLLTGIYLIIRKLIKKITIVNETIVDNNVVTDTSKKITDGKKPETEKSTIKTDTKKTTNGKKISNKRKNNHKKHNNTGKGNNKKSNNNGKKNKKMVRNAKKKKK